MLQRLVEIDSVVITLNEGDNLLANRCIELSHGAADVLPVELNQLDSDTIEVMTRSRLEILQHQSALAKQDPLGAV
jgi:hypothetical protein